MPPASVNTIARPVMSHIDNTPSMISLRDFVVEEDAAQISNTLWRSMDHSAYILAQREAIETYNMNKALRLSEETAAVESIRRAAAAAASSNTISVSVPATIISITPPDSRPGSSSISESAKQKSPAISHHDRKPSSSASAQAARSNISSQPRLSLSTAAHSTSSFVDNSASAYSSRASNSVLSSSSTSQSLAIPSHRIEQRSLSKREPESSVTKLSITMSPPSSSATSTSTSSHTQPSDTTNAKRRRAERQPSVSPNTPSANQQSQQQRLVMPAVIDSKNSTASARLTNPPPTPVEPRPRRQSTAKSPTSAKPAAEPRDLFTTTRSCTKCGTPVPSPRSQPLVDGSNDVITLLHITCTKCHTMHCRGCFAVARCNRALVLASSVSTSSSTRSLTSTNHNDCAGSSTCTVRNCCAAVRAIAIFEALCAFDDVFASEAGFGSGVVDSKSKGKGKEYRDVYVRQIIGGASKSDKEKSGARRFEDSFIRTLKAVGAWLQPPDDDDSDGGYTHKSKSKRAVHTSIPRLLASSLLLEVVHVFLSNTQVRDWVAHAEAYIAVLDALKWICKASASASATTVRTTSGSLWGDSLTLKSLLQSPLRRIDVTSGLRRCVWGDGNVRYEDTPEPNATGSAHRQGQIPVSRTLCDLIQQLESHRRPLMTLATKATFEATVGKVNNLCDGIIYLMLQQVVGDE